MDSPVAKRKVEAPVEYELLGIPGYVVSERAIRQFYRYIARLNDAKKYPSERVPYGSLSERYARQLEMLIGEYALARWYGVPYEFKVYYGGGDAGYDSIAPDGTTVNVKCSSNKKPRLLVREEEVDDAELYVLMRYVPERRVVWLLGEKSREDVVAIGGPPRRVRDDGPVNYIVSLKRLSRVRKRSSR